MNTSPQRVRDRPRLMPCTAFAVHGTGIRGRVGHDIVLTERQDVIV